jgi:hypothetical protein
MANNGSAGSRVISGVALMLNSAEWFKFIDKKNYEPSKLYLFKI